MHVISSKSATNMALAFCFAGPHFAVHGRSWKELYVEREIRSSSLLGAFKADLLHGHTAPARCVKILPGSNLVASGGYDRSMRLWDLDTGMPLAATAPLDDTVSGLGYVGSKFECQNWLLLRTAKVSSSIMKSKSESETASFLPFYGTALVLTKWKRR